MLYNEEFIGGLPGMNPFENPWIVGICKNDELKGLRDNIEKWYGELPENVKPKFFSKLRSQSDVDFIPAFHELVIHRYCVEEGWKVEFEPKLESGLTPDLMVHSEEHGDFVIEVTTLFDSNHIANGVKLQENLTYRIGQIKTDFVLGLNYESYPPQGFAPSRVVKEVSAWLTTLPNDEETHRRVFTQESFSFEVEASTTMPQPRLGCVLMVSQGGNVPNYANRVKRKLDEKRKKYSSKGLGIPVVVAIGDGVGRLRVDSFLIDRSLFGDHQLNMYPNGEKPSVMTRDRSGHFTPSNDSSGEWFGKNTGVSAVMFSSFRGMSEGFEMKVFHNPVAEVELPYGAFRKMPQLVRQKNEKNIVMNWTLGEAANKIDDEENQRIIF